MADDRFDGGAPAHLAADGLGDTPDLTADPDLEPVRIVVAAIALVAVDAADRDTCKLFEIGDGGAESMAIIWVAGHEARTARPCARCPEWQLRHSKRARA